MACNSIIMVGCHVLAGGVVIFSRCQVPPPPPAHAALPPFRQGMTSKRKLATVAPARSAALAAAFISSFAASILLWAPNFVSLVARNNLNQFG